MGWFSISCRRVVDSLGVVNRDVMDIMVSWVVDWDRVMDRDIMVNRVVDIMVNRVVNSMVVMTMMHHMSHMWILLHVIQWHTQVEDCLQAERMTSHFSLW